MRLRHGGRVQLHRGGPGGAGAAAARRGRSRASGCSLKERYDVWFFAEVVGVVGEIAFEGVDHVLFLLLVFWLFCCCFLKGQGTFLLQLLEGAAEGLLSLLLLS